jgi:hypothetical protein
VYDLYCAGIISSHTGLYTVLRDAFVFVLPGDTAPYSCALLETYILHDAIPDHEITELIRLVTAMMTSTNVDVYDMFCEMIQKDTYLTQGSDVYRLWSPAEIVSVMHCDMYFLQIAQTAWKIRMSVMHQAQSSTYIGLLVHPNDIYATKNLLYILSMSKAPGQSYIYEYFPVVDTYPALSQTGASIMQTYG